MNYAMLNSLSDEQLQKLNSAIVGVMRARRDDKIHAAKREIRIGSIVQFASSKRGGDMVKMRVTKINIKTIEGSELGDVRMNWKVTASLCELVTDKPTVTGEPW